MGVLTAIRPVDDSLSSFSSLVVRGGRYSHSDIGTMVRTGEGELYHGFSGRS